jgi:plastocyanin
MRALGLARRWVAGCAVVAILAVIATRTADADGGRITGTVRVIGADGKPAAADAVIVYVVGFTEAAPVKPATMTQKHRRFVPDLVAVTVGQGVAFPNADSVLHNVFSRSATRPFDLGQYKKGDAKVKSFPKAGVVDVYCNIHPEMAATIVIVPNRAHTVVAADGTFVLAGVPVGTWTVFAYTRLAVQPARAEVTVAADADATVSLEVTRGPVPGHSNKYGEPYRDRNAGKYR